MVMKKTRIVSNTSIMGATCNSGSACSAPPAPEAMLNQFRISKSEFRNSIECPVTFLVIQHFDLFRASDFGFGNFFQVAGSVMILPVCPEPDGCTSQLGIAAY